MKRYKNIPVIKSPEDKRMYRTVRYPQILRSFSDIYVYTTSGDRFDTLAQQYYNDSSLWWIISIANNTLTQSSLTPPLGIQLRIPTNTAPILAAFRNLNSPTTTSGGNGGGSGTGY